MFRPGIVRLRPRKAIVDSLSIATARRECFGRESYKLNDSGPEGNRRVRSRLRPREGVSARNRTKLMIPATEAIIS